jgi:hypothetical protein
MEEEFRVQNFGIFGSAKQDKEKKMPLNTLTLFAENCFVESSYLGTILSYIRKK